MEIEEGITPPTLAVPAPATQIGIGSGPTEGYLAHALIYAPAIATLFTTYWSVGVALLVVVAPLTWLGRGGTVPAWMLASTDSASG